MLGVFFFFFLSFFLFSSYVYRLYQYSNDEMKLSKTKLNEECLIYPLMFPEVILLNTTIKQLAYEVWGILF